MILPDAFHRGPPRWCHSLGSIGSLSSARTPKTHSWTRRSGSRRTNRSSPSIPSANSRNASDIRTNARIHATDILTARVRVIRDRFGLF